ncbi:MAG: sugar ABC transporter permease, partial [Anaerolineae bacterium]|nr:sugar ABC transporter permease [Anaerolineae bacterium]
MSLHHWRVRKGDFIGIANYQKAIGDWEGALIFVIGVMMLVLAYYVWRGGNHSRSREGNRWPARASALLIVALASALVSKGWGRMFAAGDQDFLNSLRITLYYALGTVPAEIAIALVLAYILFQQIRGQEVFRMFYFLPYITPVVATAVVFRTIFNPRDTSLANQLLRVIGVGPYKWLFEPRPFLQVVLGWNVHGFFAGPSMALVSIILFGVWTYVGYNTVIFLAGLGSIPRELYEAAEIDGANEWQLFRHITLPLLSPITFYLSLIAFIGTFKAFNHIYVMRMPSALGTVDTASVTIFDTFYKANKYGYATAEAFLLFLVILSLTLVQNKVFGERVFYG